MKLNPLYKKEVLTTITILASLVYFITAFNSHGFYHADEHYQIIDFASFKIGTHTPEELAWEFKAQIRPSLQPIICFVIKTFELFDIINPYSQAFILRMLSALFALITILFFIQNTKSIFKSKLAKTAYYSLSFFLWNSIPFTDYNTSVLAFQTHLIIFSPFHFH